jgi:hypothetical protein
MKPIHYTVGGIPARLDPLACQQAQDVGKSLNSGLLQALARGLSSSDAEVTYHDLDCLADAWVEDPDFDAAMEAFDSVDADLD